MKRWDLLKWLIGFGDLLLMYLVFVLAVSCFVSLKSDAIQLYGRELFLILNVSYFISLYFSPIRIHNSVVFIEKIIQRAVLLTTVQILVFSSFLVFLHISCFSVWFLAFFYLLFSITFILWRVFVRMTLKFTRRKGYNFKRVIIVGAGKNGLELYDVMSNDAGYGFNVLGFFDDNYELKNELDNYIGMTHEVESYALKHGVDEIYCTLPGTQDEKIHRLMNFSEKNMIRFYIVPEIYRNVKKSLTLEILERVPILSVRREPLEMLFNRFLKRLFDILFSLVVLVTVYPILYIILGCLIKLESSGPILFKQIRTGLYGHNFVCFKFRTMRLNKESELVQATKNDPRITRIGAFLRKSNLDEFPQFWNVLRGDMSVVGPRPHMLKQTELYSMMIDRYMVRHLVKPGITGWAQVTGFRGETKSVEQMEERVKRDVWYIENWSFFLDLKIIVKTVVNMIHGESNAY